MEKTNVALGRPEAEMIARTVLEERFLMKGKAIVLMIRNDVPSSFADELESAFERTCRIVRFHRDSGEKISSQTKVIEASERCDRVHVLPTFFDEDRVRFDPSPDAHLIACITPSGFSVTTKSVGDGRYMPFVSFDAVMKVRRWVEDRVASSVPEGDARNVIEVLLDIIESHIHLLQFKDVELPTAGEGPR
jgi:hypothetical protein